MWRLLGSGAPRRGRSSLRLLLRPAIASACVLLVWLVPCRWVLPTWRLPHRFLLGLCHRVDLNNCRLVGMDVARRSRGRIFGRCQALLASGCSTALFPVVDPRRCLGYPAQLVQLAQPVEFQSYLQS